MLLSAPCQFTTLDSVNNNSLGPRPTPRADPDDLGAAARVLEALRGGDGPLRIGEIAAAVGSHDNTIRGHLATLLERELIEAVPAPARGRGRPALLYSARPRPGGRAGEYRALAGAFAADLVASGGGPRVRARARRIGRAWGEHLATGAAQEGPRPDLDTALSDLGFGPERDGDLVRLTTCPLLDLAVANPDVICQVHLGLVDGIVDRREGDPEPQLTPFAEPGACHLRTPRA
ncbi:helix-turn-helix domain-containing protein [Janibacter terrae]|uniref:Helix-turn-helix domain-containing protein n=1 Tax=Janibacter terrae TaxID=103817 RepID=A0ABZ2FJU4_9MICO